MAADSLSLTSRSGNSSERSHHRLTTKVTENMHLSLYFCSAGNTLPGNWPILRFGKPRNLKHVTNVRPR